MSEKEIASFFQDHPYLIAPGLGGAASFAEKSFGAHRLDLLFRLSSGLHSIVEFKRVPLRPIDIQQVYRYWKVCSKQHAMAAKHYLVGLRPRNKEAFAQAKKSCDLKIMVRIIPDDVPNTVRWCSKSSRYIRYNDGDKDDVIELFTSR